MEQEKIFERLLQLLSRHYRDRTAGTFVDYLDPGELRRQLDLDHAGPGGDWEEVFAWVEKYLAHAVKTGHPGNLNRM